MRTVPVLSQAAARAGIAVAPSQLQGGVNATPIKDTQLLRITPRTPTPSGSPTSPPRWQRAGRADGRGPGREVRGEQGERQPGDRVAPGHDPEPRGEGGAAPGRAGGTGPRRRPGPGRERASGGAQQLRQRPQGRGRPATSRSPQRRAAVHRRAGAGAERRDPAVSVARDPARGVRRARRGTGRDRRRHAPGEGRVARPAAGAPGGPAGPDRGAGERGCRRPPSRPRRRRLRGAAGADRGARRRRSLDPGHQRPGARGPRHRRREPGRHAGPVGTARCAGGRQPARADPGGPVQPAGRGRPLDAALLDQQGGGVGPAGHHRRRAAGRDGRAAAARCWRVPAGAHHPDGWQSCTPRATS